MKNVYKWRIVTNKYLYLTDENNAGPFIFNKVTKERIYECSGTPQVDDYGVDEGKISQIVSEIRDAHTYETMFNNMVNLAMCDADAQKLHFLTYDNYFNLDSEECVQEAVTPKCEGYEPVFKISAHTIDDTEVSYTFFPERNEQDKTLRYNLDLGIPRGLTGEKGEAGESGCQGAKGDDGKSAVIVNADATVYTLPVGSTPEAQVEVVPESATTEDENQYVFHFNFGVPQGSQGERGVAGRTGAKGKDAIITDASATIDPLEYGQQPQVSVSATTIPTQEENQTELRFHFDIPAGPQGEVGPAGAPSVIHEARVERIDTLEPGSDASVTVEAIPYEQSANSYDLVFNFGIPRGADGSSGGGGGGWTYNIDDPTFIEDAGISVPYGQFNTVYHPGEGEADVTLTIHYPSSWGQGGGGTPEIKHRYNPNVDSLSEGVLPIEVDNKVLPYAVASGIRSHAEGVGNQATDFYGTVRVDTETWETLYIDFSDFPHNYMMPFEYFDSKEIDVSGVSYTLIPTGNNWDANNEWINSGGSLPSDVDCEAKFTSFSVVDANDNEVTGSALSVLTGGKVWFEDIVFPNATGVASHTEGYTRSHGSEIIAEGDGSHAEGYSIAGGKIIAEGDGSHAQGYAIEWPSIIHANGKGSFAGGYTLYPGGTTTMVGSVEAEGDGSFAFGTGVIAYNNNMTAIGRFNKLKSNDNDDDNTLFVIGNGTGDDDKRSNVLSVDGVTKKVTLAERHGGIKFESGGSENVVWNTSGGTTNLNSYAKKIPEIEYVDTTRQYIQTTGVTYTEYPYVIMPVFTGSYYGIYNLPSTQRKNITYNEITAVTEKEIIERLIGADSNNVTIKVGVPFGADSEDTITMYAPGSIIRDGGDKFVGVNVSGNTSIEKAEDVSGTPIESCLIFGSGVQKTGYFLDNNSSILDETSSVSYGGLTPMLYAIHLVKMGGNYYKGGFPITTNTNSDSSFNIGIWGHKWT